MPTVPVAEQQVREAPLPGVRVNTEQPIENFGGGSVVTGPERGLKDLTSNTMDIAERSYHAANLAAKMKTQNDLDTVELKSVYGTTDASGNQIPGAIQRISGAGPKAFAVVDEYLNEYDKNVSSMGNGLANDEQKATFQNQAIDKRNSINKTLQTHAFAEMQRYQKETLDDGIQNSINLGTQKYYDPSSVEQQRSKIENYMDSYGKIHGFNSEEISRASDKSISQLYQGVIEKYFANDQDQRGRAYYNSIKDNVKDKNIQVQLDKLVHDGTLLGDAQRIAVDYADRFTDKSAAVESLMNSKLSDDLKEKARPKLEDLMTRKLQAPLAKHADDVIQAANVVAQTGDYYKIPPAIEGALTDDVRSGLQKIARNTTGLQLIETNPKIYNHYMTMTPLQLSKLPKDEVALTVRSGMSNDDFAKFSDKWKLSLAGIGGNPEAIAKANELHAPADMVMEELKSARIAGINPGDTMKTLNGSKDKRDAYKAIFDAAQTQINTQSQLTGKKVSDDEKKNIIRGIVNQHVFVNNPAWNFWSSDESKPISILKQEDKDRGVYVQVQDIPIEKQQALFRAGLQSGGIPIGTPFDVAIKKYRDNFQKAAGAAVTGADINQIRAIMGGK